MDKHHFTRSGFIGAALALAAVAMAALPTGSARAATRAATRAAVVTTLTSATSAQTVNVSAGSFVDVAIAFASPRPGALRLSVSGLPAGVSATSVCPTIRGCIVTFTARASAPVRSSRITVTARGATRVQRASLVLVVRAAQPSTSTVPPAAQPPAAQPAIVPPAATPTTPPVAPNTFTFRPDTLIVNTQPAGSVTFSVNIVRDNWTGPVAMVVDTLPTGWGAAFLPANPTSGASTLLQIRVPAGAATADYPIQIHGTSATSRAASTLVVRVLLPQPTLTILSTQASVPGGTAQFVVDARSLDDPTQPVTLGVDTFGTPSPIVTSFSANPAIGNVSVYFSVPLGTAPGSYGFNFVVSRAGVVVRVPGVLVVSTTSTTATSAYTFTPTAVTPVGGDSTGYALSASSGTIISGRGASASFDVTVAPKGGFNSAISVALVAPGDWVVGYSVLAPNVFRVSVSIPATSTAGTFPVTLQTSSGGLTAALTLTATIS